MTVYETWYHDPSIELPPFSVPVTYELELVPATEQLEGIASYLFFVDTPQASTSCEATGAASGVRIVD